MTELLELFCTLFVFLADVLIIAGGPTPYVFQYIEICRQKSARGFSLIICLTMCTANILRVIFWFEKRFEIALLVHSVVTISCMLLLLDIAVRMDRRITPTPLRTSIWKGDFITAFWKWTDFSSFAFTLMAFTALASISTYLFNPYPIYLECVGVISLLLEVFVGVPQLIQNYQRGSTQGMSIDMVLMWLIGDVARTAYFIARSTLVQFWICSCLQITIDILILLQVYWYNRKTEQDISCFPCEVIMTED